MIEPSIGRVVWVQHRPGKMSDQPEVALIVYVHGPYTINVAGFDASGEPFRIQMLRLVQDSGVLPITQAGVRVDGQAETTEQPCPYAQWMPYQKGQAAKTEAMERHLGAARLPSVDEANLEQQLQVKGLTAPRITGEWIDSVIRATSFHVFAGTHLTVCVMTLANGFTVTGESACVSAENFDQAIGEEFAYKDAREKIWPLEAYLLAQRLYDQRTHAAVAIAHASAS